MREDTNLGDDVQLLICDETCNFKQAVFAGIEAGRLREESIHTDTLSIQDARQSTQPKKPC